MMTFGLIGVIIGMILLAVLDAGITKLAQWEIDTFHSKPKRIRTGFFAVLES